MQFIDKRDLISDPLILILDEPTSGLDSFIAAKVMKTLKTIAQQGKTVICSIHQPSSEVYSLFDQLLILSDGCVAFSGTTDEARHIFSLNGFVCPQNHNPADFYISKLSIDPENEQQTKENTEVTNSAVTEIQFFAIRKLYLLTRDEDYLRRVFDTSTPNYASLTDKINTGCKRSFFVQFYHLFNRCCIKVTRDPSHYGQLLILWALIFGSTFYSPRDSSQDVTKINSAMFYMLITSTYQSAFLSVLSCLLEYELFRREHRDGLYSSMAYYWAKCFAQILLATVTHSIFVTLMYPIVNLNWHFYSFAVTIIVIVLSVFCAEAMGTLIAYSVKTLPLSMVLINNTIGFLFVLSGFFFPSRLFPTYFSWVKHVDWLYYAYKLLVVNQWKTIGNVTCPFVSNVHDLNTNDCFMSGKQVIDHFEYESNDSLFDISVLVSTMFVLRILASIILCFRS
ncbi:protein white-like isoform X4 [Leptotrombidium deliense]|uniref:Protein white-like isoform X4 n=1 Tax=Leptotrombidium deliense TaxID=299467 RepID=A0A443S0Q6_9ACAR|nr:protein white-like isoform X4 [Leptotrombidium deliense]